MSQHYDILSVNAVLLLASGCGYMIVGQQNTGVVLLLLSLCNIVGIITKRIADLEQQRKEMELLADIEEDYAEAEAAAVADAEAEEEETEDEQEDAKPPVTDAHYCGSEPCGAEITNLDGAGLCAGCGLVYYCDTTCQRADWKAGHKLVCDRNSSVRSADIVAEEADIVAEEGDNIAEEGDNIAEEGDNVTEQPVTQEPPLPPSPESEPPVSDLPPPPPPPARATKAPYVKDTGFLI